MKAKAILIPPSFLEIIPDLEPEQTHELFLNIHHWRVEEEVIFTDKTIKLIWKQLLPLLEKQHENYLKKLEGSKKGVEKRKSNQEPSDNQVVISRSSGDYQDNTNRLSGDNHRESESESDKEIDKEIERESEYEPDALNHSLTQFNTLMKLFGEKPKYRKSNESEWNKLTYLEQQYAFDNANQYVQWEERENKSLRFYLIDKKWEWDLTIPTKTNKIENEYYI